MKGRKISTWIVPETKAVKYLYIYLCEYYHFCGNIKAVIIAENKNEALKLFAAFYNGCDNVPDVESSKAEAIGSTHLKESKVIMTKEN